MKTMIRTVEYETRTVEERRKQPENTPKTSKVRRLGQKNVLENIGISWSAGPNYGQSPIAQFSLVSFVEFARCFRIFVVVIVGFGVNLG